VISIPFVGLVLGAVLVGTAIGTLTGLLPGLHTNNVAAVLVVVHVPLTVWLLSSFSGTGLGQEEADVVIVCLIASAAITHTFVNFIPATFLGAPESDTALSVLPGHRMLLEGRGYVAVRLSAQGSLGALLGCLLAVLALRLIMGTPIEVYDRFKPFIPGLLMLIVILLVMSEGNSSKRHRRIHRTWSYRDKLRPCLLVEGIEEVTKENLLPGKEAEVPVIRPWMLSPLQGERVKAKGTISIRDDRWHLWDRDSGAKVRMVFEEGEGPPKERPDPWKQVWVTGKVCRSLGSGSRIKGMSWAITLFILSGILGFALLHTRGLTNGCWSPVAQMGLAGGGWTLVPLFTGLFGLPTLLVSYSTMPAIPKQSIEAKEALTRRQKARGIFTGTLTGSPRSS